MNPISLTLPTGEVTVAGGSASLTASVTNGSSVPARIVLGAFGPRGASAETVSALRWTRIDRPSREIPAGVTEQFSVGFTPEPGVAPGRYPVRLIAYSAEQAPEEYADQAQAVEVVVPEPAAPPPPEPKKTWWPYALAAVALLAVVGVVIWLVLPDRDSLVVPDWTGQDRMTVQTQADDGGFVVVFTERVRDPGSEALPGTVIDQSPPPGTEVENGSQVSVVLAQGVTLPDWTGKTTAQVEAEAAELGLTEVSFTIRLDSRFPRGTVMAQDPDPNALVSPDEPISVVIAQTGIVPTILPIPTNLPTLAERELDQVAPAGTP